MQVQAPLRLIGIGLALVALALAGCGAPVPSVMAPTATLGSAPSSTLAPSQPLPSSVPIPSPNASFATAQGCPRTIGQPTPASIAPDAFFGAGSSYGNGLLWVGGLWPDGIIEGDPRFVDDEGRVGMKFGWWRAVAGRLVITGYRSDASAPAAIGDVPDGYGDTGFQASGVTFPTEGCWNITGTVGTTSLTFTTFVIKTSSVPTVAPTP